jgi:hypothetical protein
MSRTNGIRRGPMRVRACGAPDATRRGRVQVVARARAGTARARAPVREPAAGCERGIAFERADVREARAGALTPAPGYALPRAVAPTQHAGWLRLPRHSGQRLARAAAAVVPDR